MSTLVQVTMCQDTKELRKKIHQSKWEHQKLEMQVGLLPYRTL